MQDYSTFVGIDSHKKYCAVDVQDREGNVVEERIVETKREILEEYFSAFGKDTVAVLESTYN